MISDMCPQMPPTSVFGFIIVVSISLKLTEWATPLASEPQESS